jgi:heme/copper-type cytochrome/quinol oxidase subunit 2
VGGDEHEPNKYFGRTCDAGWTYKSKPASWTVPVIIAVSVLVVVFVVSSYAVHFYRASRNRGVGASQFESI